MRIDKIILRAILSTLAAIGVLLVFMIASLCALFPSTMMKISYDLGMESASIHFAERAYNGSGDVYFIAYATEVAIEQEKTDKTLSCGELFIADEEFDTFCALKGESYQRFIYGQVCVSQYKSGEKEEAVTNAYTFLEGKFPKGNPLSAVLIAATEAQDGETVAKIVEKLKALEATVGEEDADYLRQALKFAGA